MKKKAAIGVLMGVILLSVILAIALRPQAERLTSEASGGRIAVIYVEGVITGEQQAETLFGVAGASSSILMEQIRQAKEDPSIKAVILRINSPGGSAAASQEIGSEIDKLKKSGKVVVASMGDVAASGGYWLAAKADYIVANPATTTGSIGVIMQTQSLKELFDKLGIKMENITSGKFKDVGAANKTLTEEERQLLQAMVDDIYDQFVDVVVEGRKLKRQEVIKLADGRVYTGRQAKKVGLVDELGNYYDAIEVTKKLAKLKGEPEIYEFGGGSPFQYLFGAKGLNLGIDPEHWLYQNLLQGVGGFK